MAELPHTAPLAGPAEALAADAAAPTPGTTSREPRAYAPSLAFVNFGVLMALLTPVLVSMTYKLQRLTQTEEETTTALGLVLGVGALFALVANPLVGRLSDRTVSRFGMRRPWILGGSAVGLVALVLVGTAQSVPVVLIGWCLAQTSLNAVLAASNATLPDQVVPARRGKVSGIVGTTTPLAILAGSLLAAQLPGDLVRFALPGVIAVVAAVIFAFVLRDRVLTTRPANRLTVREFFGSFVFNPLKHRDFAWTWPAKFFIMFGYAGVATFLPLYLGSKFGLGEQAALGVILTANIASTVAMAISSPLGGYLSDKLGKRRPFVAAAGLVMVIGLIVLALAPSVAFVILGQAIIGLGAGSFFSVDLALATQVLPNPEDTAKDLGVLNIANALPQSLAPAIAPAIIALGASTALGGYVTWYLFGALVALAGAVLVYRIKGVK